MTSKAKYIACLMATACSVQFLAASGVRADAASGQSGAAASQANASTLSEVIVTAQKHSENVQRVPIAITALTRKSIVAQGVKTTEDILFAGPAVWWTWLIVFSGQMLVALCFAVATLMVPLMHPTSRAG